MAVTPNSLVTPQAPVIGIATLTSPTAITSRANIAGTTGLVSLTPTSNNGKRVDWLRIKSKGASLLGELFLWLYDGTTSYLFDEVDLTAITGSTTVDSLVADLSYIALGLNLPANYRLFVSVSVAQDLNVFAMSGDY
jgi:hypothetical protein